MRGSGASDAPVLGFPEKFDLALRYGEELVHGNDAIDVSDRLLLDALAKQAQHGACNAPRPSLFDAEGRARYSAWCQLGNTSKMEAMFMYTRALEELAPEWWRWPPLELVPPATNEARPDGECGEAGADTAAPNGTAGAEAVPPAAANHPNSTEPPPVPNGAVTPTAHPAHPAHVAPPSATPLASEPEHPPGGAPPSALRRLTVGGWTRLAEQGAPARYRHACVVVGARLLVYGGRANSGRLAASICVLDLLSGVWSEPTVGGAAPEQRWGHTMCAYRGLAIVFGGHRGRGSLCDTPVLDTQSMAWASPSLPGPPPPPRGTHAAAVCADRLWVMGGDSPAAGALQMDVWSLPLRGLAEACSTRADAARGWEVADTSGGVPPPCRDGTACACGPRVLLIGGAGPSGYAPMASLWLLHVEELSWSAVHTSGSVPRPRAGHCSATVLTGAGGWRVYVFGGGNSATGFDDLHVLDTSWRWSKLERAESGGGGGGGGEDSARDEAPPGACEGAAMASSGGMLLLCGGYSSGGATRASFAWGCEGGAHAAAASPRELAYAERRSSGANEPPLPARTLLLLSCPSGSPAQAYAQAAQAALTHGFTELQVVAVPAAGDGGPAGAAAAASATSQEQALSMMLQRLEELQLQWRTLDGGTTSLLSQAHVLGSVQPCRYTLMAAGTPRVFSAHWIGLLDLASGRSAVASTAAREVAGAERNTRAWGSAKAAAPADLDVDSALLLTQAWRSLIKSW